MKSPHQTKRDFSLNTVFRLRTWNNTVDEKIWDLLSYVNGDISDIIDTNGVISCRDIDKKVENILIDFHPDTQIHIQQTLHEVRYAVSNFFKVQHLLKKCTSLKECQRVLQRGKSPVMIDAICLNTILKFCENIQQCSMIIETYASDVMIDKYHFTLLLRHCQTTQECIDVILKYKNNILFDEINTTTILKIVLKDRTLNYDEKKKTIKDILETLNAIWFSNEESKWYVIRAVKYHSWRYKNSILDMTSHYPNLSFLKEALCEKRQMIPRNIFEDRVIYYND